jgi:hypothetical protein
MTCFQHGFAFASAGVATASSEAPQATRTKQRATARAIDFSVPLLGELNLNWV